MFSAGPERHRTYRWSSQFSEENHLCRRKVAFMPKMTLPSGVEIEYPALLEAAGPARDVGPPGRRKPLPTGPIPISPVAEDQSIADLLTTLSDQDLQLVDQFDLRPTTGAAAEMRRGPIPVPGAPSSVSVEASVGLSESAVVLTEHDGVYRWHLDRGGTRAQRLSTRAAAPGQRLLRFEIELLGPAPQQPEPAIGSSTWPWMAFAAGS